MTDARSRVFVALDVPSLADAIPLMDTVKGTVGGVKIGNQLFTAAGPPAVEAAHSRGFRVFLDLKLHDIPNTVAGAVREAARLGVFMLNVHASGGRAMMRAAAEAAAKAATELGVERPLCLGVTVLTSLDRRALQLEAGVANTVEAHVLHLATAARDAGLAGCVASPQEITPLRLALGSAWVIVTPGIRPSGPADDQVRTASAAAAVRAGADYLVVGRPITQAGDPAAAAAALVAEIAGA
ncbi:MAG: orotidine-5'-phosphate decarboxylase [Candidatus Rokubacteria bacterium]|nr:orotidine-5'-phosphate decarboxylase [Candidatus Rokubacteria bacterium]